MTHRTAYQPGRTAYQHGCRCTLCVELNRKYNRLFQRARRAKRALLKHCVVCDLDAARNVTDGKIGTLCERCKEARRRSNKQQYLRRHQ